MPDNFTTMAKDKTGADVTIEIPIPDAQRASDWNDAMATAAQKANVEIPGVTPAPIVAATMATTETQKKEGEQPTLYRASLTVNGKEMLFEGPDAAQVLSQYTSAVQAAQLAGTPAATTTQQSTTEQKPALTAADMFEVGTKLISGDASGLDTLLEKSGALDRWFEKQGISVDQIKAATQKTQSDTTMDALATAKDQFIAKVKAGEIDFPGGAQNEKMMGIMLARIQGEDKAAGKSGAFTLDSFERAYALMKAEGLVFAVDGKQNTQQTTTQQTTTQATSQTKTAPSSTITGTAGGAQSSSMTPSTKPKIELDMTAMSGQQFSQAYNAAIDQGYKPGVDLFVKQ